MDFEGIHVVVTRGRTGLILEWRLMGVRDVK